MQIVMVIADLKATDEQIQQINWEFDFWLFFNFIDSFF